MMPCVQGSLRGGGEELVPPVLERSGSFPSSRFDGDCFESRSTDSFTSCWRIPMVGGIA